MRSDPDSWRPALWGDEPRQVPSGTSPTGSMLQQSDCREGAAGTPNDLIVPLERRARSTGEAAIPMVRIKSDAAIEISMYPSHSGRPVGRQACRNSLVPLSAAGLEIYRRTPRIFLLAWVGRSSRLCVLMNPILPGAIHANLPAKYLKILPLWPGAFRGCTRGELECKRSEKPEEP
jgi:hypothetical protein